MPDPESWTDVEKTDPQARASLEHDGRLQSACPMYPSTASHEERAVSYVIGHWHGRYLCPLSAGDQRGLALGPLPPLHA